MNNFKSFCSEASDTKNDKDKAKIDKNKVKSYLAQRLALDQAINDGHPEIAEFLK